MALPDKILTAGQQTVMTPVLSNFQAAQARLQAAQQLYNDALAALEEYVRQSAEKLTIDVAKDYTFDLTSKTFKDRTTMPAPPVQVPANMESPKV